MIRNNKALPPLAPTGTPVRIYQSSVNNPTIL